MGFPRARRQRQRAHSLSFGAGACGRRSRDRCARRKVAAGARRAGVFTAPLPQKAFVFGNPFVRPPTPAKNKPEWVSKCDALVFFKNRPLNQATTREQLIRTPGSWFSSNDGQQLLVHLKNNTVPAKATIEVTTRDRIFAPHRRGLGYIRVEGFVFERCATRPDWPQLGALSTPHRQSLDDPQQHRARHHRKRHRLRQ